MDEPISPDPRVYFAAERTLLAWIRTGLTIMAFGFVVARFGLFLRLLALQQPAAASFGRGPSPYLGAGLVVLGVVATAFGGIRFRRFCRDRRQEGLPAPDAAVVPMALAGALVVAGSVLVWILLR
jgi:putative membrane protein